MGKDKEIPVWSLWYEGKEVQKKYKYLFHCSWSKEKDTLTLLGSWEERRERIHDLPAGTRLTTIVFCLNHNGHR